VLVRRLHVNNKQQQCDDSMLDNGDPDVTFSAMAIDWAFGIVPYEHKHSRLCMCANVVGDGGAMVIAVGGMTDAFNTPSGGVLIDCNAVGNQCTFGGRFFQACGRTRAKRDTWIAASCQL
jgi:hypothetical protein